MWQAQAAALILYVLGTGDSSWARLYKSTERDLFASSAARRSSRLLRPSIDHICPTYGFPSVLANSLSRATSRPPVNCCSILVSVVSNRQRAAGSFQLERVHFYYTTLTNPCVTSFAASADMAWRGHTTRQAFAQNDACTT